MFSEKNNLQTDFEGKKIIARKYLAKKVPTLKKYLSRRIKLEKILHRCMAAKRILSPEVWEQKTKSPTPPPTPPSLLPPLKVKWSAQRGEFHISHDASRQISVFFPRWKERSRVSSEIFNDLNFKMQLIQDKFQ